MVCIIVERGVSEKNNIMTYVMQKTIRSFFKSLDYEIGDEQFYQLISRHGRVGKSGIVIHGLSQQISLTSVLLGTILDKEGVPFSVIDDDDVIVNHGEFIKQVVNEVSVVALSTTYTVEIKTTENLLKYIRKYSQETNPSLKIVLGGQGLLSWMENGAIGPKLFEILKDADYFVFGEVDKIFGVLMKRILKGESVADFRGVVYKQENDINNSPQNIQVEAGEIASPDWSIIKKYNFNNLDFNKDNYPVSVGIEEGRGCKFRCRFCSYSTLAKYRRKEVKTIVAELKDLYRNDIKRVAFLGAEFLNPLSFSIPVLTEIGRLKFPLEYWAFGRLDTISRNPQLADLLKEANFTTIQFGLESGSKEILIKMNKKFDPTNMSKAVQLLRDRDIEVKVSIIIGYPGETKETLNSTKSVLKDCNFGEIMLHGLSVTPGTPLHDNRQEYGIKLTPYGWAHETMRSIDLPYHIQDMIVFLTKNTR